MRDENLITVEQSKRVQIKDVKRDYLVCEIDNPIDEGEKIEIKVAKPYNIRASSYDGKTVQYTSWSQGTTINVAYTAHASSNYNSRTADYQNASDVCTVGAHIEMLYPPYMIDDFILVSANAVGNEGDNVQNIGSLVHWVDQNREGRYWKDDCGSGGGGGGSVWV